MLTYASAQLIEHHNAADPRSSVNVLLVSDWIENLARLRSVFRLSPQHFACVTELHQICQEPFDFVVTDVGPEYMAYALRAIRAHSTLRDTPLLVRSERLAHAFATTSVFAKNRAMPEMDSERLAQEYVMTSVLAKYRAMPGLDGELMRLILKQSAEKEGRSCTI